jgi:membrane protein DedA with SNARE-associated domain
MAAPSASVESLAPSAPRSARRGILVAAAALYATGTFGSNIAPAWIEERPEVVLALSSRNRNLLFSVPNISPVAYALIGFARLFVVAVVLYYVGAWFGARALAWTESKVGELPAIYRWFQTGMDRAGWAFVVFMPGSNLVCMMAGHRQMPIQRFVPLLSLGIALKLAAIWVGGRLIEDELESMLEFVSKYQWWLVGGLFALSFIQSGRKASRAPIVLDEVVAPPSSIPPSDRVGE